MMRRINLSNRAVKRLDDLLAFLEKEWSPKVKNNFILKLDKSIRQIQKLPESFPASEKIKGLRKCTVTKQTTVYYSFSDSSIDIVTIFDNRKNPESLRKEVKNFKK